jgi:hypothetical protein
LIALSRPSVHVPRHAYAPPIWRQKLCQSSRSYFNSYRREVPFAELVGQSSFDVLDAFYADYGELSRFGGNAPDQSRIRSEGGTYLDEFPQLDYITGCSYVER